MCALDARVFITQRAALAPLNAFNINSASSGQRLPVLVMGRASPRLHAHQQGGVHLAAIPGSRNRLAAKCVSKAKDSVISGSDAGDTETCSPGHWPAHLTSAVACLAVLTNSVEPTMAETLQSSSLIPMSLESHGSAHSMHSTPQVLMHSRMQAAQLTAPTLISLDSHPVAPAQTSTVSTGSYNSNVMDMSNIKTADLQLPLDGWLPVSTDAPTMSFTENPSTSRRQQDGWWLLGHSPLLVLNKKHPVWWNLAVLVAANILGIQLVLALLKRLGDRSEPVTLLRLQLGLVHPPGGPGAQALAHLRERLAKLNSMIQMGQHGLWLIVEEATLELAANQQAAALADVEVVHLDSKREAYSLFGELAVHEASKARAEEGLAHVEGEGDCLVNWSAQQPARKVSTAEIEDGSSALAAWLMQQPHQTWDEESGCDDAMVVTFVVVARGHLQVPNRIRTWQDACDILKQVCGLSSEQLMAVDLTWAPSSDGTYLTRGSLLQDYANLKPITTQQQRHHQHR